MCGRFSLAADVSELQLAFPGFEVPDQYAARYNIAPTQPVMAITSEPMKKFDFFKWGLVPSWSKDPSIGTRMINARGETIAEKPSYKGPFKYKRCLVPSTGFYEWKTDGKSRKKTPYYFHKENNGLFAIAGLWDEWLGPDGSTLRSLTLITTTPNEVTAPYHDRMPVIISPDNYEAWLYTPSESATRLLPLIKPLRDFKLNVYQVNDLVNSPKNDNPDCVLPYQSALF